MTRLSWDAPDTHLYTVGVDRGVFYPQNGPGVAWNGLVTVEESPSDTGVTTQHLDGQPYRQRRGSGSFAATIEALTYPDEFADYEDRLGRSLRGRRETFGLSYRTVGRSANDDDRMQVHLVYNAVARPSNQNYSTLSSGVAPLAFSWGLTTTPLQLPGLSPMAHIVIDIADSHAWTITAIEDLLYGSGMSNPRLPDPIELIELFESGTILRIIDHGDGTWTATGPDEAIQMLDATTFQISWPTVIYIDDVTFQISSR